MVSEELVEEPIDSGCRHHWAIDPADGPLSKGACQKCGEAKTFTNYIERHDWANQGGQTPSASQSPDREGSVRAAEIEEGAVGEC